MITLLDRSVWDWNQVVEGGNIIHIEIKALQAVDTEKAIMQHQHSLGTRLGKKLNQSAPIYEQVKRADEESFWTQRQKAWTACLSQ